MQSITQATQGPEAPKRYMRTRDAAKYTLTSTSFLEKCRVNGGGPRYAKLGKTVVYDVADLDAWLDSQKRSSTSDTRRAA